MKKTLSVCCLIIMMIFFAMPILNAQNEAQPEKRISYNLINEYGFYVGGSFGLTGVFVNSIKFNHTNDLLGIGIGCEFNNGLVASYNGYNMSFTQSIPIFVNYRHYFVRPEKSLSPLVNIAFGPMFNCWTTEYSMLLPDDVNMTEVVYRSPVCAMGLYGTIASGFKVKAFSLTGGIFFRSNINPKSLTFGVESKVGFTF